MADRGKKGSLPWGLSKDGLKPNSVQSISKSKLAAFSMGMMNPLKRAAIKKKDEKKLDKKMAEAKETAEVFEEFVASFEDTGTEGKAFVRGSTFNPEKREKAASMSERPKSGGLYKPPGRFQPEKKEEPAVLLKPTAVNQKPQKKKGTGKKKSILELFREELKRAQTERKDRHAKREAGVITLDEADEPEPSSEIFEVEEYKSLKSGSLGTGDSLTTNLYVGNINPNLNEEKLCQMFGKFGPLASIKVMWPRTEEERAKNRNCGFVAFMKREDAEKALEHFKGTTIMDYEVLVGWGKAVPLPPHPVYVPPDIQADEKAKHPDPPSGLPFNAQTIKKSGHKKSGYVTVAPPGSAQDSQNDNKEKSFEDTLFDAMIRVVIPTDIKLLRLIHRVIEFVIREGPMFEAMIMNKEINNPVYQFLFDNQGPAHIYYRWKLFSILQGDSPETWCTEDFRMFVHGSLWKPPPLKNLRMKLLPPVEEDAVLKRGQLSASKRDDLEDQLRRVTMERGSIRKSMVWCLDHADSAEEIVDCISESLTIAATPLPMKLARLFLVSDILHNCSPTVRYSSNFRRGFESKLNQIFEHFSTLLQDITSRMRAENFRRRVLACVKSWDMVSIFHFNFLDKLRETFFGKTQEEVAKQKAFDTVAALMAAKPEGEGPNVSEIDGVPLFDDRPIDFSGVGQNIDGVPLDQEDLDGTPLHVPEQPAMIDDDMIDGVPLSKEASDIDGIPMEEPSPPPPLPPPEPVVRSKWELVDYDSDEEEGEDPGIVVGQSQDTEKQQLLAELEEKKRRILRDVEVKVVELSDALESTGSYSKADITLRVDKYRDKLMNEAVQPKITPPTSPRGRSTSRSPSPSILANYELEDSPRKSSKSRSPKRSPKRKRSKSPQRESPSKDRSRKRSRSHSPPLKRRKSSERSTERKRSPSPSRRRSRSPKRKRSRERSPVGKRSSSPSTRKRSRTPQKSRKKSPSPSRKRSRSRSPKSRKRSSSPSPSRKRSRSRSPQKRKRSASPSRKRSRSPRKRSSSPSRKKSRSRSPQRKRSRSPRKRSHSPRKRSRSPRKRSRSPRKRSRSPRKRSRSPRKRSRSPRKSRNRSRSPKSQRHKSRSKSPSKSSKKKKRSRSRSPHKSSKSGKKSSRH